MLPAAIVRTGSAGSAGASPPLALFAVFCSAMIYVFTQRECWSFTRVGVRFALTGALLGVAAMWLSILAIALVSAIADAVRIGSRRRPAFCAGRSLP